MKSSDTPPPNRLCRLAEFEPQQMLAVLIGFADPQFADHAAIGKNVLHSRGLLTLSKTLLIASSHSGASP